MLASKNIVIGLALLGIAAILVLEKFAAGSHIFQLIQANHTAGIGAFLYDYGKAISRIATLACIIFAVLSARRISHYRQLYSAEFKTINLVFLPLQLCAFFAFYFFAPFALPASGSASLLTQAVWVLLGFSILIFSIFAAAPWQWWRELWRQEKLFLFLAFSLSILVWVFGLLTQNLWGGMSEATFFLVERTLTILGYDTFVDYAQKLIGIQGFLVNIAPACSGYEGIGLITAFTSVYLFTFKSEFRFPRALWLLPIGAAVIWCFNVLRIVVLIIIGATWSPEVAVKGFHTQAGWITFIATSVLMMVGAHKIHWFLQNHAKDFSAKKNVPMDTAVATLIPIIALLSTTFLTQALSGDFDWLYPIRVVITAACIIYCWKALQFTPIQFSHKGLLAIGAGVLVAALWVIMVKPDDVTNHRFAQAFATQDDFLIYTWLAFRFIGTAVTVPIAEELGFRAYMLCKVGKMPVITRGQIPFSLLSFCVTSLAFGFLHGDWIAGTVAGLVYALVRYRSAHIADAIAAHSLTNAILFAYAALSGDWYLL